jgi:hypothetical protein
MSVNSAVAVKLLKIWCIDFWTELGLDSQVEEALLYFAKF